MHEPAGPPPSPAIARDASDPGAPLSVPPKGPPPVDSRIGPRPTGLRFHLRTSGLEAVARLGGVGLRALVDALLALLDRRLPEPARRARAEARAARLAARCVAQLGALKGVFVKAGQFAAVRYDVLPPAWRAPLATLRDRVPPLPFETVRRSVEAALGRPLDEAFASFEPLPIGAASVAQVHRAVLPDGRTVAVKVLYPWIADALPADLRLLRFVLRRLRPRRGPALDVERLTAEFEAGLRHELDLRREARVAREIAANLADDPRIVVPEVVWSHSSERVLTVLYFPTIALTDGAALADRGIDPGELLAIIARAYAKQVFVDGLFHADPHPGNVLAIDEPGAGDAPRVLFIDFGLSMRLSPRLRRATRRGIHALLQRDLDGFVAHMDELGMIAPGAGDRVRAAVGEMFGEIERTAGAGGALGLGGGEVLGLKDRAKRLLEETPGLQLPNELLLYARTISYLFALGAEVAPGVDLMKLVAPYLLRFLAMRESEDGMAGEEGAAGEGASVAGH